MLSGSVLNRYFIYTLFLAGIRLEEADLLIHDCAILTMDHKQPIIEKGFLAIKDKCIMALGKKTKASSLIKAEEMIGGAGKVAMLGSIRINMEISPSFPLFF